jgi:ribulose-phosphate 3-epimerase
VGMQDLLKIKPRTNSEAHLMVKKPLDWVETFKKVGSSRIIFHVEISENIPNIIKEIRKEKLQVGIAINPGTQIKDFSGLIDQVDVVLFMSVNPGFYGAAFIPEVLEKIKKFKKIYPDKTVGIDGGIKLDNIIEVKKSGADYICVGSAILKAASPEAAYQELVKKVYG